ncbi:MAG: EAL domain-containing protein [Novosphingobium sp.]
MKFDTGQQQVLPSGDAQPRQLAQSTGSASVSRRSANTARIRSRSFVARYALGRLWPVISPVMLGALAGCALIARRMPPLFAIVCIVAASALVIGARWGLQFERSDRRTASERSGLIAGLVGTPMLLFGLGFGNWVLAQPDFAAIGTAGMVAVSMLASILSSGRLISLAVGLAMQWAGFALVTQNPRSFAVMIMGAITGAFLIRLQLAVDRRLQEQLERGDRAQQRAEMILSDFEQTRQGWFWETDRRGAITYVSSTIGEIVGRDPAQLVGRPFYELFVLDGQSLENERTLTFHMATRCSFHELAVRANSADGHERWWSINGLPVYDDYDNFQGFRGSGSDLTEKRRSDEHATRLAHYDSLTGLANRLQISQLLEKILTARVLDQRACAVFLLDLDRFKQVNDTLGHPAGDALLTQVSQRLERVVGTQGRVGRLGGDEFQVIVPGRFEQEPLAELAERIIEALSQPYSIDGHQVVIGVSIGIALSPDNGVTSEALIRNADLALYAAKDGGRGRHHFYASDLHSDAEERRQLEQDLRDALVTGGFTLAYQPVVTTTTERISGFEALLRWRHPKRGWLSPSKFIPIAEESGLIAQIGEWALRTACHDMAAWPENVRVAVNVSPLQFANPSLPALVTNALAASQITPARLELEITESVFLNDSEGTDAMFAALKRVGVRLALDDFGTGYSSLGYLKKAPFDKIKIDQSFVRGATITGSRNGAIISAIVSLAEALDMETTAEGVETHDELDLIRQLGCSHVQGYIYAKPLSTTEASALLIKGLSVSAEGPRSARPQRQTMLRRVVLEADGERYNGTIRNISSTGALVAGLWNVPPGTQFNLELGEGESISVTARWSIEDRMGVEFKTELDLDEGGRIVLLPERRRVLSGDGSLLRRTG